MYNISLITGDGIGPELSESVNKNLNKHTVKITLSFN